MSAGIHAFGGYVPRLRLQRRVIAEANAWFNPALRTLGRGERAIAGWDEDAITMAVEAARDCLARCGRDGLAQVILASTTLPFQDRQNAGVVAEALHLAGAVGTLDVAGSQRAGTSALNRRVPGRRRRRRAGAGDERREAPDEGREPARAHHRGRRRRAARRRGRRRREAARPRHVLHRLRRPLPRAGRAFRLRLGRALGAGRGLPEDRPRSCRIGALGAAGLDAGAIDHFCFPSPMRRAGRGRCEAARAGRADRARQPSGKRAARRARPIHW